MSKKLSNYLDDNEGRKDLSDYIVVDDSPDYPTAITPGEGDDVDNIIKDYIEGYPRKYIQAKYRISNGQLSSHLQARGVPLRYPRRREYTVAKKLSHLSQDDIQEVIRDYLNGMSCKAIYNKYNIHKNGLYTILDTHNIKRKRGE